MLHLDLHLLLDLDLDLDLVPYPKLSLCLRLRKALANHSLRILHYSLLHITIICLFCTFFSFFTSHRHPSSSRLARLLFSSYSSLFLRRYTFLVLHFFICSSHFHFHILPQLSKLYHLAFSLFSSLPLNFICILKLPSSHLPMVVS